MYNRLLELGFSLKVIKEAEKEKDLTPGRVISQSKDLYKIATNECDLIAEVSGKFRYEAALKSQFPVVGDYVLLDRESDKNGNGIIHQVMKRYSILARKTAGNEHDVQVIAANIDKVFICMSLNNDFNLRRLERYLSITWESGATPIVVLTKADLCEDVERKLEDIAGVTIGVDVVVTSSVTEDGYKSVLNYINRGNTIAFVGSSGVGKSTLINCLLGENVIQTSGLRNDDKGRHTTTRRELFIIPSGGVVIDTPGMREIGLEGSDISRAFTDIEELSEKCKYRDCTHKNEPMCAIRQAIEDGVLSAERFSNYEKLKKEAGYEDLNSRQIEKKKIKEMFSDFDGIKNARDYVKSKYKKI